MDRQRVAVVGGALLALSVAALAPVLAVVIEAVGAGCAAGTWRCVPSGEQLAVLFESVILAATVTLFAIICGVPIAFLAAYTDLPGRRAVILLHAFPSFLPPFLIALGWYYVFGRRGLLGSDATAGLLFGRAGAVMILGTALAPLVSVIVLLGFGGIDPSLIDAARLAAGSRRTVTGILLPLARPAIGLAAVVVFALALSEVGVPTFLRVRTYAALVFSRLAGIDYAPAEAAALAMPLVGITATMLGIERWLMQRSSFGVVGLRSATVAFPLGAWRLTTAAIVWFFVAVAMVPLASLAVRAGPAGFVGAHAWIGETLTNGLVAAAGAATVILVLAIVLGAELARRRLAGSVGDAIAVLAFVAPAAILGIGIITVWNRPPTRAVYGSIAVVTLGYVGRYAVIGIRAAAVMFARTGTQIEDAAAAHGARYLRRLVRIVAPIHWRGLAITWIVALVACLRDLELPVLFYPAGREPLQVRIFTLEANGPEPVVAGLAVVHVLVTACILAAGGAVAGRIGKR